MSTVLFDLSFLGLMITSVLSAFLADPCLDLMDTLTVKVGGFNPDRGNISYFEPDEACRY